MKASKAVALPLLLVIMLGTMGLGFAWWTETLNIAGNAETGEFNVKIVHSGWWAWRYWSGIFWETKASYVTGSWDLSKEIYDFPPSDGWTRWAGNTLTITLGNLYPHTKTQAALRFPIVNIGTVPAKIGSVTLTVISDPGGLAPYIKTFWTVWHMSARVPPPPPDPGGPRSLITTISDGGWGIGTIKLEDLPASLYTKLKAVRLDPDQAFHFDEGEEGEYGCLGFRLDETAPDTTEGKTITFTLTFVFKQWNY